MADLPDLMEKVAAISDGQLIEVFRDLRKKKEEIEAQQKLELQPVKQAISAVEAVLLKRLQDDESQSKSISDYTVYRKTRSSVTAKDWTAAFGFIQENERWDFLPHAVNKTAVLDYIEAGNETPPGVNVSFTETLGYRSK